MDFFKLIKVYKYIGNYSIVSRSLIDYIVVIVISIFLVIITIERGTNFVINVLIYD